MLVVVLTCQLMVVLDGTIVNIALPQIRHALHFSTANLSWVLNAYTLSFGGLLLLGARAGDILGRRTTFVWGITLFTVASMLGGLSQNSGELLTARAAQGVGGALASPAALALLMSMFSDGRERTRAIGLYTAVSVGGSAVGLLAGGVLVQLVSWRWVLFVNVPIGIVVVVLARMVIPETARHKGVFDLAGALTSTVGMSSLVYGFVRAASDGWGDTDTIVAFVIGVVLLTAFVLTERRASSPITPLRLFADRNRVSSYLARLFVVAGMFGMFFFLSQFLQNVLHYSPIRTGLAFLPITILLFASSQAASKGLIERVGAKLLMIIGLVLSTAGLAWLTQLSADSGYGMLFGPLALFGIGNGLAFVPLTTAALSGIEPEDAGAASGLVNVMQQVGGSLGLAILVTIFGAADRHAASHPPAGLNPTAAANHAFVAGADRAFDVATLFVFATLLLVIFAIRSLPTHAQPPSEEEQLIEDLETTGALSATASG
ncbi:MAG TPA: MFS transporter [Mycobacteriales bacterium]|nr:MFS transporter [Mycobacteriales bacterium]